MKSFFKDLFLKNEQISRLIIGLLVASFGFSVLYCGGLVLSSVLVIVFWQVNTEFINIVRAKGINPSNKWIRFVSILFFLVASLPSFGFSKSLPIKLFIFVFVVGVVGCLFRLVFRGNQNEHIATTSDIGTSVLGFVYTGLLPSFLILLRELGFEYAFVALFSTAFCDIGAFYGGRFFGKTALKPEISSKKTLEGALSGFFSSMIISVIIIYFCKSSFNYNIFHGVMIGLFTGVFSQLGDLFESLLKRDAGLKDSGTVLLSHGGLLDRLDSYFFVVWAVYFYVSWFVLNQLILN